MAPPTATAGFPLLCGGHPVALLQVEAHAADELSPATLELLEKLARNLSLALDGLEHQRHKHAAERALLDNAIRFRDAAGAAGEYVWEVDLEGHFTYLSEGIERISGYRPEELVGRTPIDLMPEQDREPRARVGRAENVGPDGSFRDFEHQVVSRQGEVRWVRVSAVGLLDANGNRIGQRGTGRDITERKLAEQHLAESRQFLDELINAVPDPISVKDEQHRFVAVNDAFCRVVGCTREAILGQDDSGLIPAEEARQVWHTDEAALKGSDPVVYERGVTLQGAKRWMLVRKSGITRSDGSRAVLSVFTDITERRAMEQAVRESETRFRDFTAAASEFVWENDLEGRFTYVSSRVQSVWGYSEPELLGRSPAQFDAARARPSGCANGSPAINNRTAPSATSSSASWPRTARSAGCSVNAVGMFDENGRRIGQRGAGRDITERKQAEARIAELATRDPLSGLPNRVLLNDRLQHALATARRRAGLGRPHVHRPGPFQARQRQPRPRGRRRPAAGGRPPVRELPARDRHARAPGRRRVRGRARRAAQRGRRKDRRRQDPALPVRPVLHRSAHAGHQRQHRREHLPDRRRRRAPPSCATPTPRCITPRGWAATRCSSSPAR